MACGGFVIVLVFISVVIFVRGNFAGSVEMCCLPS